MFFSGWAKFCARYESVVENRMPMLSKDNISPKYFTKNGFDKIWMMKHIVAHSIENANTKCMVLKFGNIKR